MPAVLTTTLVAAPPAPRPLKRRALPVPDGPLVAPNSQLGAKVAPQLQQGYGRAPRPSRRATQSRPPIKAADQRQGRAAAAGRGRAALRVTWLCQKASLTQRAVDKALPTLHVEDVYDLHARHSLDSLGDVFSRVVALQVVGR
eukprot:scaffold90660_cov63-Phaeocystis_antarctica.AAC.1